MEHGSLVSNACKPYCTQFASRCTSMTNCRQTACDALLVTQVLKQHQRAISDLDWSLDNTFLLSAGLEGSVTMWMAATGQLLRIFLTTSPACCAKFHLVNQNLIITGTESGVLQVFNCSTGMHVMSGTHGCQYTTAYLHAPISVVPGPVKTNLHHHFNLSVTLQQFATGQCQIVRSMACKPNETCVSSIV